MDCIYLAQDKNQAWGIVYLEVQYFDQLSDYLFFMKDLV